MSMDERQAADITRAIDALIMARIRAVTTTDENDVCNIGPILQRLTSAIGGAQSSPRIEWE